MAGGPPGSRMGSWAPWGGPRRGARGEGGGGGGVPLGARAYRDRAAVGFDPRVDPAGHLLLVTALEVLARLTRPLVPGHVAPARGLRSPCGRWVGPRGRSAARRPP